MHEFAERTVKLYSGNKAKTEFYSQLFIASTIEVETMSNSVRKFNKLHKFMNFSWESFRWLRQALVFLNISRYLKDIFLRGLGVSTPK